MPPREDLPLVAQVLQGPSCGLSYDEYVSDGHVSVDDGVTTEPQSSDDIIAECVQSDGDSSDDKVVEALEHATEPSSSDAVAALDVV